MLLRRCCFHTPVMRHSLTGRSFDVVESLEGADVTTAPSVAATHDQTEPDPRTNRERRQVGADVSVVPAVIDSGPIESAEHSGDRHEDDAFPTTWNRSETDSAFYSRPDDYTEVSRR